MSTPRNCTCGWGGVHDPDNPKCEANQEDARDRGVEAALRSALERTERNLRLAINWKPVRDLAENLAENEAALSMADTIDGEHFTTITTGHLAWLRESREQITRLKDFMDERTAEQAEQLPHVTFDGRRFPTLVTVDEINAVLSGSQPSSVPQGVVGCSNHEPVQHRDRKPPWCRRCGLTAAGTKP